MKQTINREIIEKANAIKELEKASKWQFLDNNGSGIHFILEEENGDKMLIIDTTFHCVEVVDFKTRQYIGYSFNFKELQAIAKLVDLFN